MVYRLTTKDQRHGLTLDGNAVAIAAVRIAIAIALQQKGHWIVDKAEIAF